MDAGQREYLQKRYRSNDWSVELGVLIGSSKTLISTVLKLNVGKCNACDATNKRSFPWFIRSGVTAS